MAHWSAPVLIGMSFLALIGYGQTNAAFPVKGRINENGSGAMILHRAFNKNTFAGVVRFSANQFAVDYDPCGTRHAIGHRTGPTT